MVRFANPCRYFVLTIEHPLGESTFTVHCSQCLWIPLSWSRSVDSGPRIHSSLYSLLKSGMRTVLLVCKFQISLLSLNAAAITSANARLSSAQYNRDSYLAYPRVLRSSSSGHHQLGTIRRLFELFDEQTLQFTYVLFVPTLSTGFFPFGNRNFFDKDLLLLQHAARRDEGGGN